MFDEGNVNRSRRELDWVMHQISDADEPGDTVMVGMRHRYFSGVLLQPDGKPGSPGWFGTDAHEVALAVFPRGTARSGRSQGLGRKTRPGWLVRPRADRTV